MNAGTSDSAEQGLEQWLERLADKGMPVFRATAESLLAIEDDSGQSVARLCASMLIDPGAVAMLLRRVNGRRRSSLASNVTTPENAAMMLGFEPLRNFAAELAAYDPPGDSPALDGYSRVVGRAIHAAYQAYDWASRRADILPKEVFVAALLYDIGEMLLWLYDGDLMARIEDLVETQHVPADEAQYPVLGFSLEQLSHALAQRWGMPDLLQDALAPENATYPRVLCVMRAAEMGRLAEQGWYSAAMDECIEGVAELLDSTPARVARQAHLTALEMARDTAWLGVRPAAALLPLVPAVEEEAAGLDDGEEGMGQFCLIPQFQLFDQLMRELHVGIPAGSFNLNELMQRVMRGLHEGLGLNRVVFAMLTLDKSALRARFMAGTDNDPAFNNFELPLHQEHLFAQLLRKQQSVWVHQDNHDRLWQLVPGAVKQLIQTETFFCMSVFVNGKPIGIFYADRHLPDAQLDAASYDCFKRMCALAARGIEQLRAG